MLTHKALMGVHSYDMATGGRFSDIEAWNHIKWLDLKAWFLRLQSFAKSFSKATIHVDVDDMVGLSYSENQGKNTKYRKPSGWYVDLV